MKTFFAIVATCVAVAAATRQYHRTCPPEFVNIPLTGNLSHYKVGDFGVITLNDFHGMNGDVELRVLAGGNAHMQGGYSIGNEVYTGGVDPADHKREFSFIVGGDLQKWESGSLMPDGNQPAGSAKEYLRLTGSVNADTPQYLQERIGSGYPYSDISNEVAQLFSDAMDASMDFQACVSGSWASWTDKYGGMFVSGPQNPVNGRYCLKISVADWNKYTWYAFENMDAEAEWIITLESSDVNEEIVFEGAQWPGICGRTLFNVPTANPITVKGGSQGHILAPLSDYRQPYGVTVGTVLVGNIPEHIVQVNRVFCNCECCSMCENYDSTLEENVVV